MRDSSRPFTVVLTGGIGAGKSTVAKLFAELAVPIIDADQISRELVAPGAPLLEKLVAYFGKNIVDEKGQLRRAELRERIFRDPGAKQWLEQQLHPQVYVEIQRRIKQLTAPYVLVVIPLLLETGHQQFADRLLVVDATEAQQLARASARDQCSAEQVEAILKTQVTRKQRFAAADDVIHNQNDVNQLQAQVMQLHQQYLRLAAAKY